MDFIRTHIYNNLIHADRQREREHFIIHENSIKSNGFSVLQNSQHMQFLFSFVCVFSITKRVNCAKNTINGSYVTQNTCDCMQYKKKQFVVRRAYLVKFILRAHKKITRKSEKYSTHKDFIP